MKIESLRRLVKMADEQGVGYALRLECLGGHAYEGPHFGINADGTILIQESTGRMSSQDTLVDIGGVVAATIIL